MQIARRRGSILLAVVVAGLALLTAAAAPSLGAQKPYSYVALGDSFSAGEGVRPFLTTGLACHRSSRAYSTGVQPPGFAKPLYAIASGSKPANLGGTNTYGSGAITRSSGNITWATRACTGAKTTNVLRDSVGVLRNADLVTMTIGGNDLGYVTVLFTCAISNCATPAFESDRMAAMDAVEPKLEATYRAVAAKAPHARILVLGYPQPFPESPARQACPKLALFQGKQDLLRRLGVQLNATIEKAATRVGGRVQFVSVADRFAGHEICGAKGAWLNAVVTAGPGLNLDPGSFHPNLAGQRDGYTGAVNDALR